MSGRGGIACCVALALSCGGAAPGGGAAEGPPRERVERAPERERRTERPAARGAGAARGTAAEHDTIELTVTRAAGAGPALVQGGVPLPAGLVAADTRLAVLGADGTRLVTQTRPLLYHDDGRSVAWLEVTFVDPALAAGETRRYALQAGAATADPVTVPTPPAVTVTLVAAAGTGRLRPQGAGESIAAGPVGAERVWRGGVGAPDGEATVRLARAVFPAAGVERYRVRVEQQRDGGTWRDLTIRLPGGPVTVADARGMGATTRRDGDATIVDLLPQPALAVDRGVARQWEIWVGGAEPAAASRPLTSPQHVRSSGGFGPLPTAPPPGMLESARAMLAARDADPRNGPWNHRGDAFDGEHGPDYAGYLNQEYDPATALFLAQALTADASLLREAEIAAGFYRDMALSPEGGSYQHRATLHALVRAVVDATAPALEGALRDAPGFAPTAAGLEAAARARFGAEGGSAARRLLERRDAAAGDLVGGFVRDAAAELVTRAGERARAALEARGGGVGLRDVAAAWARDPDLRALGFDDPDADLAPFFARYGGSWSSFPGFHVDRHPDPAERHAGSHSLAEMLVHGYAVSGDDAYLEVALGVARYHVERLVPREVARFDEVLRGDGPLFARSLGWPLIDLIALHRLAAGRDDRLAGELHAAARTLAGRLADMPYRRCEGGVSAGVALEALARYHEATGDEAIGRALVEWASWWARTQWNAGRRAFTYRRGAAEPAWPTLNGLLLPGLAYAATLAPQDAALRQRALAARDALPRGPLAYAKSFAMVYRGAPRGVAWTERLEPSPPAPSRARTSR